MMTALKAWREHSDEVLGILAFTCDAHNAITPVLSRQGEGYCCYLLLCNNRTSQEYPLGIFHPHQELHHIKKENIGLIEAMSLFILPGRLKDELQELEEALSGGQHLKAGSSHAQWAEGIKSRATARLDKEQAHQLVRHEVGQVCYEVLRDTGVYKQDVGGPAWLAEVPGEAGYARLRA